MEFLSGGKLGELFTALSFASALVAMFSYFIADQREGLDRKSWERLADGSFWVHALGVVGVIGVLFYLIYTHNYAYHYVWSHSSNELPVYYMISCFWEGQEGSFLLWAFWHAVLGLILIWKRSEWTNAVQGIVSSVQLILMSMLLGAYVGDSWVYGFYLLGVLVPAGYLAYRYFTQRDNLEFDGNFHLGGLMMGLAFMVLMFRGQLGFGFGLIPQDWSLDGISFALYGWLAVATAVLFFVYIVKAVRNGNIPLADVLAGTVLLVMALVGGGFEPLQWKLGSSPFIPLKAIFPDEQIYLTNPDFVPSNGNGLNPLLQNYWMVIHPPTLFLGFAATLIPFAFVMAGLIRGKYTEWIRPALPWTSFSVMVLGVGIIMGGYWAYETLNFGGYWNWDPVENASLVPWLIGVASLHAMLVFRKTKSHLKMTMLLIIFTFLLVLYSTFLNRSGILGETSVHTFTDLGLSGQLIALMAIYGVFVLVTLVLRWKAIPTKQDESKVWSAEFMLFIGILIFVFSGIVVTMGTSLPVLNKIFGTNWAAPPNVQLFYYKWMVWFAILFGAVSGIGQFLWWKIKRKGSIADAMFRPFATAAISGAAILIALMYAEMDFAYDKTFAELIDPQNTGSGFFGKMMGYLRYGIIGFADELLLFSSLFGLLANFDVLVSLLIKNKSRSKVMGGTIVHMGFAMMMLGMLFSSGYDEVISKNLNPEDLAQWPDQEKVDNVPLPKFYNAPIKGYSVSYIGVRKPEAPIEDLRIIEENPMQFKAAFEDQSGETWAFEQPRAPYLKPEDQQNLHNQSVEQVAERMMQGEVDLDRLQRLLEQDLAAFEPQMINNRTQYGLKFTRQQDTADTFTLWPEAEINDAMGNLIAHPSRKVYWNRDIYVYTSSLPNNEQLEPQFVNMSLRKGDTTEIGGSKVWLRNVVNLSEEEKMKQYDVAAAAILEIDYQGQRFYAEPVFLIEGRKPGMISDGVEAAGLDFAFVGVTPEDDMIHIQARYVNPKADYVIIKAISKPFINLLWLGTFLLTFGFILTIVRRTRESMAR
ncbi:cytochrome c biogenesis protein CcsA [Pontibacter sp. G13]|uniref:cytochrome c biogenesis protein CcsA n=1 Tax=Pontibacter sp. G13 TaxID=3074898 RepID=UPI00288B7281|nr:cytochrome c biogenesis protein CcsA [Pontibacter sp. G13]WNJ17435.1 cytochrome c biogenesis protein CcsA [Pontibacter sp. G13]